MKKTFDLCRIAHSSGLTAPAVAQARDIEAITDEILALKQAAGRAVLDIGQRLTEAKEMLPHGAWLAWLNDRVEFSERTAQNFMRLARDWSNPQALADLGATKALTLLALPAEERAQFIAEVHVVDGEAKAVADMTTRELEQAVRERDAARQAADAAQAELAALRARPVDVAVMAVDQEKLDAVRAEAAAGMQAKVDAAQAAKERAEQQRQAAEAALAEANGKLAEAAKAARRAQLAGDRDLAAFELLFGQAQEIANQLHGLLLKARSREDSRPAEGMQRALAALAELIGKAAEE